MVGAGLGDVERRMFIWVGHTWTCAGLTAVLFQSTCVGLTAVLFQITCVGLSAILFQSTCDGLTAILFQSTKPLKVTGSSLQHAETRSLSVNLQYRYMVRNFSNSILCGFVWSFSVLETWGIFSGKSCMFILEGRGKGKALVVESLHLKDSNTQLRHF